ncbi:MAG: hypothetical protein AAGU21_14195 [Solidesulfovibrio sp.]|uniref:hypothetical protein n=1 Tax=Solidesulfovibrio sp. TaxID=2910990 RepID=UPI002B20907D|nr:hypothetical protein [Solidesulfovibrio sp.]MEA4856107.1 hypothetical protein [Solidesulfovibrio sp.]
MKRQVISVHSISAISAPLKGEVILAEMTFPRRGMGSAMAAKGSGMKQVEMSEKPKGTIQASDDERLEAEALRWCERLGRKLDRKRSKGKTRRGTYDNRSR